MCTSFKNNVRFSSSLNAHQTLSPFFTVARAGKKRQRDRETDREVSQHQKLSKTSKTLIAERIKTKTLSPFCITVEPHLTSATLQ